MTTVQTNEVSQSLLDNVNGKKTTAAKGSANATQDRFLTLLVQQLKNQDPLNPMDNAAVTSQLAQLSTVSGIEKLNATLESMMTSNLNSQSLQSSNLIGHEALVAGNQVHFDGTKGEFGIELPSNVDDVKLSISDGAGNVVREIALGRQSAGVIPMNWDGYSDAGVKLAAGDYKFALTATTGGEKAAATALSLEKISSISISSTGVKLNLSNDTTVLTTDLKQIY